LLLSNVAKKQGKDLPQIFVRLAVGEATCSLVGFVEDKEGTKTSGKSGL